MIRMNWLRIRTVRNGDKRSGSDVRELLVKLVLTEVISLNVNTYIQKNVLHYVLFKAVLGVKKPRFWFQCSMLFVGYKRQCYQISFLECYQRSFPECY